jgi:hypothetical protein
VTASHDISTDKLIVGDGVISVKVVGGVDEVKSAGYKSLLATGMLTIIIRESVNSVVIALFLLIFRVIF